MANSSNILRKVAGTAGRAGYLAQHVSKVRYLSNLSLLTLGIKLLHRYLPTAYQSLRLCAARKSRIALSGRQPIPLAPDEL